MMGYIYCKNFLRKYVFNCHKVDPILDSRRETFLRRARQFLWNSVAERQQQTEEIGGKFMTRKKSNCTRTNKLRTA